MKNLISNQDIKLIDKPPVVQPVQQQPVVAANAPPPMPEIEFIEVGVWQKDVPQFKALMHLAYVAGHIKNEDYQDYFSFSLNCAAGYLQDKYYPKR